jgi:hypothetical protein
MQQLHPPDTQLQLPVPLSLNLVVHNTHMVIKLCTSYTGLENQYVTISVMSKSPARYIVLLMTNT